MNRHWQRLDYVHFTFNLFFSSSRSDWPSAPLLPPKSSCHPNISWWQRQIRLCQCVTMKTTFIMSNKARKRKVNVLESRNPNPNHLLCWFFLLFRRLWSQFEQDFFQQKARTNFAKLGYDSFDLISIIFQVLIFWPGPNHADHDMLFLIVL